MNKKCRDIKAFLNRYLDGELSDPEALLLVEGHLKQCCVCKAEFEASAKVKDLLAKKQRLEDDITFLPRLKERLKNHSAPARLSWVLEAGDLARKLTVVPMVFALLLMIFVFERLDDFNTGSIGITEINELNEETHPFVLFSYTMFDS